MFFSGYLLIGLMVCASKSVRVQKDFQGLLHGVRLLCRLAKKITYETRGVSEMESRQSNFSHGQLDFCPARRS